MPISTVTAKPLRRWTVSVGIVCGTAFVFCGLALDAFAQPPRNPGVKPKAPPKRPEPAAEMREIDPVTLPGDFEPPKPKPEVMEINRPLVPEAELEALRKVDSKFKAACSKSSWKDAASQEALRGGVKYRLAQFTLPEQRDKWMSVRDELMRQVDLMGKLANSADDTRAARNFLLTELVKQCTLLLDNNFHARLHAVYILSQLNLTDEDSKRNLKTVAFLPAIEPLLTVIKDPNQPEAVKIPAVLGVVRILAHTDADVKTKQAAAAVLVAELANEKAHPWYQRRLAFALSVVDIAVDLNRKPILVDALVKVISDSKRDWVTRAEAARSLGRVSYDPAVVDTKNVLTAIASFAADASAKAQQSAKNPHWKSVFLRLYLAFKEADATDRDSERKGPGGLLNRPQFNQANVKQVYRPVVEVLNASLAGEPIPVDALKELQALHGMAPVKSIDLPAKTAPQ